MSILADSDLERLAQLLERGKMNRALEIAQLVRMEQSAQPDTSLTQDPLSRHLSACLRSMAGRF